jgi:hypothetical protein
MARIAFADSVIRRRFALVICSVFWPFVTASGQQNADLLQHVVEIQTQDKGLIGTGTIVSFSGVILTAKHVLYDSTEASGAPFLNDSRHSV